LSKPPTSKSAATIWLADGRIVDDGELAQHVDWLTADEATRYRRFLRPLRQRQFLLGRILLRIALGDLLGIEARSISLSERPGLAPLLHGVVPVPGFSIAHSGPWVACAVSADAALGLDIEMLDATRDLTALAEQVFSAEETQQINRQQGAARIQAFYELWSRKEAAYKLASVAAPNAAAHYAALAHPEVSIVLCSAQALSAVAIRNFSPTQFSQA
jgi:4'-phosphopantetheinyl transferase